MEDTDTKLLEEVVIAIFEELNISASVNSQDLLNKYNLKVSHSKIYDKLLDLQV
jgi:hypothetical protein